MALVAALSSCTKDSAIENDNNNGTNLDLNPNAPVAIQLGAGSNISAGVEEQPKSRAVVNAWNNTTVGIYALSKAGGWKDTQNPNDPTVLWENVKLFLIRIGTVIFSLNLKLLIILKKNW